MWTLGRLLPVMIGEHLPVGEKNWNNFILLLHIVDTLLAPKVSRDEVAYLKTMIEEHHSSFVRLYPEASVIPKMHFLIHTPRLLLQ